MAEKIGVSLDKFIFLDQVHKEQIASVKKMMKAKVCLKEKQPFFLPMVLSRKLKNCVW